MFNKTVKLTQISWDRSETIPVELKEGDELEIRITKNLTNSDGTNSGWVEARSRVRVDRIKRW